MKLIVQIALGVCLGIVSGGALLMLSTGMLSKQLLNEALNPPVTTPTPKASIDDLLAKATTHPESSTPATTKPVEPKPIDSATQQQISSTPAPVAEIRLAGKNEPSTADANEQKVKEARFRDYYHKSEQCLSPSDQETRVACGNEYIRAKAKFEEIYKQGKF
jgi:hypothetical protein